MNADPMADQARAEAREAGMQIGHYWLALRRCRVPWWLAARLVVAYATAENRPGTASVTVEVEEGE